MRISWTIVLIMCALLMSGCSGVPGTTPTETQSSPVRGAALQGKVRGGQQPIVGARVYLYAANTTGYGNASVSLLAGTTYVTTLAEGAFSISGDYSCPSSSSQVYLYAVGGNPGLGEGTNSAAGLMAALGTCDSLSTGTYAVINEVSTVATAYAIAGFATDATHVSSSSSLLAEYDIGNAFTTAANLETLSTGVALATTPAGNGIVPQAEIDTLADILAACVNSSGPLSTPCSTLFSTALSGGTTGSQPSDTATAAIYIAHNPGSNVATLFGLLPPDLAFQPTLGSAPNDFTIAITYSGGGLDGSGNESAPEGIAIDGSGDVWVSNYGSNTVSEFKPDGTPLTSSGYTATALSEPTSLAIDIYGNAWVANYSSSTISEFSSTGVSLNSPPPYYTEAGLSDPYGVAVAPNAVWVTNNGGNTLSEFEYNGVALSGTTGFVSDNLGGPAGVASDTSGNIWTANYQTAIASLVEVVQASPGDAPTFTFFTGGGLNSPYGVAVDGSGNIWLTNTGGNGSLSEFSSSGTAISPDPGGFSGGGLDVPLGLTIDGAGNVWTANWGGNSNSVSELNSSGNPISGPNGYVSDGLIEPYGIAADGSGNVWVASDNTSGPLTEFVGVATPVVTPIAAGVAYKELGKAP